MMVQSQILQSHQNYVVWPHLPPFHRPENPAVLARPPPFNNPNPGRANWKREKRRRVGPAPGQGFRNRTDSQRHGSKRRRFHHPNRRHHGAAPLAPLNTTSFIIRAKRAGGITALVSPFLPTPVLTPTREILGEVTKDDLGLDVYGTMKGLIRLRRDSDEESSEVISGGSEGSESEKELDYDLSRFERIYPDELSLEKRVNQKAKRIAHLVEENIELSDRIYLVESELGELRKRVLRLELETGGGGCSEAEIISDGDKKSVGNDGGGVCV